MFIAFLLMFFSLYLAQMGDKTQLLTILLATKTKKHFLLFVAIMSAFTVSVTIAVIFGAGLSLIIPHVILHIISGSLFILLGVIIVRDGKKKKNKYKSLKLNHPFLAAFILTFLADFGDKTQLALALFAVDYKPLLVFAAGMLALGLDTILMIVFSKVILKFINESLMEKIAGFLFIAAGIFLLISK